MILKLRRGGDYDDFDSYIQPSTKYPRFDVMEWRGLGLPVVNRHALLLRGCPESETERQYVVTSLAS